MHTRTRVTIVGAGPAGLTLSHLLAQAGIGSIIIDSRTREDIERTIRAGILEHDTVDLLASIPSSRVHRIGARHDGIELHFGGERQRIDLTAETGRSVWLYPQHEVLIDLLTARLNAGQDIRFATTMHEVQGLDTAHPSVQATSATGETLTITAEFVVGADGSHSTVRGAITGGERRSGHFHEYPFAWFGILCEAPPSAEELIYSNSPDGFALISQRSNTVQRMYFQCDPNTDAQQLSDAQIWETLQRRVPATQLNTGRIFQRDVLRFRSFVAAELTGGRAALVGDAAHTVPPTGAKGMNLAIADVLLLNDALQRFLLQGDAAAIDRYAELACERIWKAQHFSWWMTSMLHTPEDATSFERLRQLGELRSVTGSDAGRRLLAECYTGWPMRHSL